MKFVNLIIIPSFLLFISCSTLLGIKSPTKISSEVAITYLKKHSIDTSNIVFTKVKSLDSLTRLAFKPNWEAGFRPVQFKIFNKNGRLISQFSICEGNIKRTGIVTIFPPKNLSPIDTNYTYSLEQNLFIKPYPLLREYNYICTLYWSTYTGIPGRKLLKNVLKYLNSNQNNILILKVNVDYIE
jgi:hypothetical protein